MTDCILHTGAVSNAGYGLKSLNGKLMGAHQAAYIRAKGTIPKGMVVMHSCDNPLCVNPEHLSVGTQKENRADCVAKGRHNAPKGESHYGAKLTAEIVHEIRASSLTTTELAEVYGISRRTISDARNGKTWRHI
ncbi:HNH homing endonuclease [Klebsiella phage vB_KpnP-VAC1]|uniref:HNH homing endonuclease n=1 Tax=Klebsiella phage vB_KpnP-VAC1 TaxID=2864360 RepID=A0AAE8BYM5_9CAUD|nr:HNH homing endonuclease [Klebsiella phage vB_KpnP-VAC1]